MRTVLYNTIKWEISSVGSERLSYKQEAKGSTGSNPVSPTAAVRPEKVAKAINDSPKLMNLYY